MTDLPLYTQEHANSEVQDGSDIGSWKQVLQNSLVLLMKGSELVPSHADFFVPFLISTMDHRKRLVPIAMTIDSCSGLDFAKARSKVFMLIFNVPSPKCFAQPGNDHSSQASNTGAALTKK